MTEKKEIGKLLELLNEYDTDIKWTAGMLSDMYTSNQLFVISKKYGFIKWLVENDKIDFDKLEKKVLKENLIRKFDEGLLMLLSISDTPIEDLLLYLK